MPKRTSDPLALLRGTAENATPMTFAEAPADAQASDTARPTGAAAESGASASPVSGSIRPAVDAQLTNTSTSARTLGIVLAGVLTVLAVMVGAAAWQNWRTDD